jgi:hypothetical protein
MQRTIIIMVVIIFVLALCPGAFAQQQTSMRCGNLFVKEGLSSLEVLAGCGEPVSKEDLGYRGRKSVGKKVERWVYGPLSGYYYFVTIEAGTVVSVEAEKKP